MARGGSKSELNENGWLKSNWFVLARFEVSIVILVGIR